MNASKVLLSFVAGAAVGAALGVLFAPDKGVETRRRISEKSNDMASSLKDNFNDFVDGIKDKFTSAKDEAENAAEKGLSKLNKVKGEAKSAMS
ncbi:MAG TPA: YtxH domain-containing protein [Puia sp.]|nr:YtxH domain-containing protein [Puia sp.]